MDDDTRAGVKGEGPHESRLGSELDDGGLHAPDPKRPWILRRQCMFCEGVVTADHRKKTLSHTVPTCEPFRRFMPILALRAESTCKYCGGKLIRDNSEKTISHDWPPCPRFRAAMEGPQKAVLRVHGQPTEPQRGEADGGPND